MSARTELMDLAEQFPDLSWASFEQMAVACGERSGTKAFYETVSGAAYYELSLEVL